MILVAIIIIILVTLIYFYTSSDVTTDNNTEYNPSESDTSSKLNEPSEPNKPNKFVPDADIISSNPYSSTIETTPESTVETPKVDKQPDVPVKAKCAPGLNDSGTTCWYDRGIGAIPKLECPPGKVQRGALCYDPPPEGKVWTADYTYGDECPTGTNSLIASCHYDRGVGLIPTLACPPGKVQRGALCYDPPPAGKVWTADYTYGDECPTGTNSTIAACNYDRGVGLIPTLACPPGKVQRGSLCYDPPPAGKVWTADYTYGDACPTGTNGTIAACNYDRGVGAIPKLVCPPGKVQRGALCYDPPPAGKVWTADYTYGDACPTGTNGTIAACNYDRGIGDIPTLVCPPGKVQRGALCYDPPPAGKVWITDYTYGDTCPTGTNSLATTCHYDRGVGKLPKLKPCDSIPYGRDDGVSCWADSYGRGAGRPRDQSCPSGMRNDGINCWKDIIGNGVGTIPTLNPCPSNSWSNAIGDCVANVVDREDGVNWAEPWGKSWDKSDGCSWNRHNEGGMCFRACPQGYFGRAHERCAANGADSLGIMRRVYNRGSTCGPNQTNVDGLCYNNCPSGYRFAGGNICEPEGTRTQPTTFSCRDDEDMWGLRCYPKCQSGFDAVGCCVCQPSNGGPRIVKTLGQRQFCDPGFELIDGLCYPVPKEGFTCTLTSCSKNRNVVFLGADKSTVMQQKCNNMAKPHFDDGLCYPANRAGFTCKATICSKGRNPVTLGANKSTVMQQICPSDKPRIDDGLCYPSDKTGFTCKATICSKGRNPVTLGADKSSVLNQYCNDPVKSHLDDGLCYPNDMDNFSCAATICTKGRNPVTLGADKSSVLNQYCNDQSKPHLNDGLCYPNDVDGFNCSATICSKDRHVTTLGADKSSVMQQVCPDDKPDLDDGLCYTKDKDGFKCVATICSQPISGFVGNYRDDSNEGFANGYNYLEEVY